MRFGYAFSATDNSEQLARQIEGLKARRCDEIISDAGIARALERPGIQCLLLRLTKGDVVVVEDTSRLTRSPSTFVKIWEVLDAKGVGVETFDSQEDPRKFLFKVAR